MSCDTKKIPLMSFVGPTASGKTSLSIAAAKRYCGEVVSCDSMQIYRYMNIATAKPDEKEKDGVRHHMLDIIEPHEGYSVVQYASAAKKCIKDIHERGRLPILVGGTGLYADAVLKGVAFSEAETDMELRKSLYDEVERLGNVRLHERLAAIDPEAAKKIHHNNVKRVIRALEFYYTTGRLFSSQTDNSAGDGEYDSIIFMPDWDRDELYRRIDMRVDIMREQGIYGEFVSLVNMGCTRGLNSMQAIGYKELFDCYRGLCSFDEAICLIKKHTRNYAKRQLTWFKRNKDIVLLDARGDMEAQCFEYADRWIKG